MKDQRVQSPEGGAVPTAHSPGGRGILPPVPSPVCRMLLALIGPAWLWIACAQEPVPVSADLVLRNGRVYTLDASRSWAESLAVAKGSLIYVGADAGVGAFTGPRTTTIDLKGRMVMPAFHDSHVHPATGGLELGLCDLNGLETEQAILEAVERYARQHPDLPWIQGGGWDLPIFREASPSKRLLDTIVPQRPVFLSAADGHSAWVNSRALQLAGIDAQTPDPPMGRIEREANGQPSGTLRESAMQLVAQHAPEPSWEEWRQGILRGLETANRFGIVSLQEASASEKLLGVYRELDRERRLSARVQAAQYVDPRKGAEQIRGLIEWRDRFRSRRLRSSTAKIFVDGVIESHTAALLQPYLDQPDSRGQLNFEPDQLKDLVVRLDKENFQVHFHAIGDRAIRLALDAVEAAADANGHRNLRHHIAHLQLIDPGDLPRFRQLNVIANFQPLWAYADTSLRERTEPVLGRQRSRWLYPMRSLYQTGAVFAAGSDWSVSSMNPLDAIQVALTRQGLKEDPGVAWIPEERMDLPAMLAAYTINGAYLNHEEKLSGSLEMGKWADLIVLDRNLFEIQPSQIHQTRILLTMREGQEVFRDSSL